MQRFLFSLLLLGCLAASPQLATAQDGGYPIQTNPTTQFVYQNGAVVRRDGNTITPLTKNVKLSSGVKINYKSGIIELLDGKKTTLKEGDYVKADGGIVFATPASAAAARGDNSVPADKKFDTYVQHVAPPSDAEQVRLLNLKVDLLNQKIALLSQGRSAMPEMSQLDQQLKTIDDQLRPVK